MGISANQARLLSLTARKCDLETQMQLMLNTKLKIAEETSAIANDYSNATSNRKLLIFKPTTDATQTQYQQVSATNLYLNGGLLVVQKVAKDATNPSGYKQISNLTPTQIEKGLRDGTLYMVQAADLTTQDPKTINFDQDYAGTNSIFTSSSKPTNTQWQIVSWQDSTTITDQLDTSDDETAQQNYETAMKQINVKETKMDVEMNTIETEHSAVSNEIESVKKIITKNAEESFKYLS
jgi:hypothetical protein